MRHAKQRTDPDAATLRHVGWRLALVTVSLLTALLLALGFVTFELTRQSQLQALKDTLRHRAQHPPPFIADMIRNGRPLPLYVPKPLDLNGEGVFFTVINPQLAVLGETGPFSPPLFDRDAAQAALAGGTPSFSVQSRDQHDYLLYTEAVVTPEGMVGVVQASITETQYQAGLQSLLRGLLAVSVLGLLAAAGISSVLVRRALAPIRVALRRQRDFVADAAHELRTPLAIVRGSAELGLAAGTIGDQAIALEQTLAQNAHLTRLVDSLSLLARADSGALSIERRPLDLVRLVLEIADGMVVLAEDQHTTLGVEADTPVYVHGDTARLRQLVLILLDNALKYTPEGGVITVAVDRVANRARLIVRDTGPGISPADLPHIFDRFYRADRARVGQGTGLGLAIGRWIATAHGGQITAANAPLHGAIFTVTLPSAPS